MEVKQKEINKKYRGGLKEGRTVISLSSSVLVTESLTGLSDGDADNLPEGYPHTDTHTYTSVCITPKLEHRGQSSSQRCFIWPMLPKITWKHFLFGMEVAAKQEA